MTDYRNTDVVIIGAGIIGSACTRACARAGLRTLLIERDAAATGATAAAMGHVVAMDDSPAQWALTRYGRELWRADRPNLPAAAGYNEIGTLWLAADDEEMAEVERKHRFLLAERMPGELLTAAALRQAEPHLRSGLAGALLVPQDAVVAPPIAAAAWLAQAEALGGRRLCAQVTHAAHGEVRLADGRCLRAAAIVLATGAAFELLPRSGLLRKRKGHLLLTGGGAGLLRRQVVELGYLKSAHGPDDHADAASVACNIQPRSSGELLVGSSRQFGDEDPAVRTELLARMLARAVEYLPALASLPTLRAWTGFRAATPDKLPLIGPALSISGDATLHLATGHEGLGITTSLATAELVLDSLLGRASAISREPYLPARLAAPILEEKR